MQARGILGALSVSAAVQMGWGAVDVGKLQWTCTEGVRRDGGTLTVENPKRSATAWALARTDLTGFEGRCVRVSVRCSGTDVASPDVHYKGFKLMLSYANADGGGRLYQGAKPRTGTWTNEVVSFVAEILPRRTQEAMLTLGLQETTGKVVFDLTSLTVEEAVPSAEACRTVRCSAELAARPQLRGVMSPVRAMTDEDFRKLVSWGAKLVRFQLNGGAPKDMTVGYGRWLDGKIAELDATLPLAARYGIKLIVDLHRLPGGDAGTRGQAVFYDRALQDEYVSVWERLARRYAGRPEIYGFGLMNEPQLNDAADANTDVVSLQERAARAVRAIDPVTPVIVAANKMDAPAAFLDLRTIDVSNVIYEVHMYQPANYTHQGALGFPLHPATYPCETANLTAHALRTYLKPVVDFQRLTGARILVGEFSAVSWAKGADAYLRDLIGIFEDNGWDWCYHAFDECGAWNLEQVAKVPGGLTPDNYLPSSDNPRKRTVVGAFRGDRGGYDVAAYVWPAYHAEPRWKELGLFDKGIGEWQSVQEAVPKWKGHCQPQVPLWGYEDESDPAVAARHIDAAVASGVNVFIYDWYWYGGRPFLEAALDRGFLGAPNRDRMKFYIMWANHNVTRLWDNKVADKRWDEAIWDGAVDRKTFDRLVERWIGKYFCRPNYYRIRGVPVLMIYEVGTFVRGLGGRDAARAALDHLRASCVRAGLGGIYLMTADYNLDPAVLKALGIDSATVYNWLHKVTSEGNPDYRDWARMAVSQWDASKKTLGVDYYPHVSVGWDTNPRFPASSVRPTVMNANPVDFERALRAAKGWADANLAPCGLPLLITVNSWNEWTEGSYLMPDKRFGYGYLDAVRRVFGQTSARTMSGGCKVDM